MQSPHFCHNVNFPILDYLPQWHLPDMNKNMNMIRHHAPSKQFIALVVKMQHGVFGNFGDSRVTQMAFTNSAIKILLKPRAFLPIVFNLEQMFPLSAAGLGHGIRKTESDELNQTGKITMRQKTAFVPAEEAQRLLFICKRTIRSEEHTSELQSLRHLVCRL